MHAPLAWERLLWSGRPLVGPGEQYGLTDMRAYAARGQRLAEIALQDIGDVDVERSRLDRIAGTSTVIIRSRDPRRPPLAFRRIRRGPQVAALIELLSGEPQATWDVASIQAALAWEPSRRRGAGTALAAAAAALAAVFAVTAGLQSSTRAPVVYPADDPISPNGEKRPRAEIVAYMEQVVMPWARVALGRIKGGPDQVTCETCHGEEPDRRGWEMPSVTALPEPHVRELGWELYSSAMDTQMRNAIYGYLAESDNVARAAYMREVVLPGMARLLHRPAYDFTRTYEYNRTRAAFGCYHCHRVK